jgi:hypothetical protein
MKITTPKERDIVTLNFEQEAFEIIVEANDNPRDFKIAHEDFRVEVDAYPDTQVTTNPKEDRCRYLKYFIIAQIKTKISKEKEGILSAFRGDAIRIKAHDPFKMTISCRELSSHNYFKSQYHQFAVTVTVKNAKTSFVLVLAYGRISSMTLAYNGPEPFYIDSTSDRSTVLELRLSGPEQGQWVNTATPPAQLIAAVQLEVVNMPELSSALKEGLSQVLQNPKKITVQNEGQDNLIRMELNHLKDPLPEDRWVHLMVSLTHLNNKLDSLPIPTVLQRPAFPGLAALDFGTTNSAIAYYGATFPVYPIQGALSTSQYKSLEDLLESLMQELEQQTLNEPSFQPLSVRLIETARQL